MALGTALLVALVALPWFFDSNTTTVTLRLVERHAAEAVTVRGCSDRNCDSTWLRRDLDPGQEADTDVDADALVELFQLERPGHESACLPARVHDGYLQLDHGRGALAIRLSEATSCPGTTVLPAPAGQPSL